MPTKTHVLNLLHRLIDESPAGTPEIAPPTASDADSRSPRRMSSATTDCAAERECAMRHDPASAAIVIMLRSLKMYGMAQAVEDLIEQGSPAFEAAVPILSQLLKAEIAEREVRSIAYQLKAARFPAYRTWPASTSPPARSTRLWSASCTAASSSTAPTTSS